MVIDWVAAPAWQVALIADVVVGGSLWLLLRGPRIGAALRRGIVPPAVGAITVSAARFHGVDYRHGLWIAIVVVLGLDAVLVGRTSLRGALAASEQFGERSPQASRIAGWLSLRIVLAVIALPTLSSLVLK
jgi:hypothetical protein